MITSWLKIDRTFTAATATTAVFCALLASGGAVQSAVKRQANARSTIASEVKSPDGTLVDGEFLNWSFNSVGGGGSAAREDSGGNPGARLRISTSAPVGTNTVTAIKDDYTTNFPFEGDTFTFSVDFLSGAGAHDDGQALLLLVQQGSDIYGLPLGITRVQTDWTRLVRNGTFNQAAFSHILGPGAPMPDFSSGAPTKFGFAGQNSDSSITNYYDNFHLVVKSPDGTLVDGEFLNWSFNSVGGGGSAAREDSGGNPGARLRISTSAPVGTNTVTAIKDDYTTNFPFEGDTFTFSVDFLSGAGAHDDGQALLLLVQQGSDIYGLPLGITRVQTDWTRLVRNGTFNQAAFSHILGPGAPMPDFSSGAPTKFGFAGQNSDSSITNYYDNFHLVSNAFRHSALQGTGWME